jgi:hypothetical protein
MMIGARGVGLHRTVLYALVHFRRGAGSGFGLCRCSARILARSRSNVIRHALQIVGAASTRSSACASRRQWSLAPLPLDRRALDYFENEKRFPGAQDRSNDQPLPATSNCARGLKWRVVCITFRFRGSLIRRCSCLVPILTACVTMLTRCDPLESMVCFKSEATADLTFCGVIRNGCIFAALEKGGVAFQGDGRRGMEEFAELNGD